MTSENKKKIIFWSIVGTIAAIMVVCTAYSLANLDRW